MADAKGPAPILICTATAFEAHACTVAFAQAPSGAEHFEVLQTGMGMLAAARALKHRLETAKRPRMIVSTGLAGSVQSDLSVGTWVMATQVVTRDAQPIALAESLGTLWHRAGIACRAKTFRTVAGITMEPDPAAPHATVVDMETYAWADVAARYRVPFAALRVISDTPEQPLPQFVASLTALTQSSGMSQKATHLCGAVWDVLRAPSDAVAIWRHSRDLARTITHTWSKIAAVTSVDRDVDESPSREHAF